MNDQIITASVISGVISIILFICYDMFKSDLSYIKAIVEFKIEIIKHKLSSYRQRKSLEQWEKEAQVLIDENNKILQETRDFIAKLKEKNKNSSDL